MTRRKKRTNKGHKNHYAATGRRLEQEGRVVGTVDERKLVSFRGNNGIGRAKVGSMQTGAADVVMSNQFQFYDPILSADYLELPQDRKGIAKILRQFYKYNGYVGGAIDFLTTTPLSSVRLQPDNSPNENLNQRSFRFFTKMCKRLELLKFLIGMTHEYNLLGEVFIWAEDSADEMPQDVRQESRRVIDVDGEAIEEWIDREDADEREREWYHKYYRGWDRLTALPPEYIDYKRYPFSNYERIEIVPDGELQTIIGQARSGDPEAKAVLEGMPEEIIPYLEAAEPIPLGTDPNKGSFVHCFARRKSPYEDRSYPVLERCLPSLILQDKIRQAQAQIASRAMTPKRLVWAEDLTYDQAAELRDQVDLALLDPDFTVVTNYEVHWEEISARDRLLDTAGITEELNRQLYAGLGVTEGLLTGESTYSGDKIPIEAINTRFMLFREELTAFIEDYIFAPVARKKGFVYVDEDGDEIPVHPKFTFTRLALRDSQDTFDHLSTLYQKGSIDISHILDLLNIDARYTRRALENDLFTVNDNNFNELIRSAYSSAASKLVDETDLADRLRDYLKLNKIEKPSEESDGRY